MKIKSITYSGIKKAAATTIGLSPLTIITGANRGGKTTVRDALLLALNGTHPSLPKTNQGVMNLASGPELLTRATFDDDSTLERSWRVSKGGSIKSETIGTPPAIAIEQFEPLLFLAMGGKARLAYLAAMASTDLIRAIIERRLGNVEWAMDIYDSSADAVAAMEAIERAIVDRRKAAKQERDRLTKALQEHVSTAPVMLESDNVLVAIAEEIIAAERQSYLATIQARNDHGAIVERRAAYEAALEKHAAVAAPVPLAFDEIAELAELERQHDRAADCAERRGVLSARIAAAEATLLFAPEIDRLQETVRIAEATPVCDDDARAYALVKIRKLREKAQDDSRFLDAYIKANAENIEAEKNRVIEEICSHCGHVIDVAVAKAQREELLQSMQTEAAALNDRLSRAQDAVAINTRAIETLEEQKKIHETAAIAMEALAADRQRREMIGDLSAELATIPAMTQHATARLKDLAAREQQHKAAELASLRAADVPAPVTAFEVERAASALAELREQHKATHNRLAQLEIAQQRALAFTTWEQREKAMSESLERAKAAVSAIEATETQFESGKTEMLASVWQPITAIANRIVAETFGDETLSVVHDGTDVGLRDLAGYRTFGTISGSEATVLAFAIGAAIASQGDLKLAIIDELGALDATTRRRFLASIANLVKDSVLEQVLVFHHDDDGAIDAGFEKHLFG
jgi:DNA repair exonuclease SbcCD ATPase subunit